LSGGSRRVRPLRILLADDRNRVKEQVEETYLKPIRRGGGGERILKRLLGNTQL